MKMEKTILSCRNPNSYIINGFFGQVLSINFVIRHQEKKKKKEIFAELKEYSEILNNMGNRMERFYEDKFE